MFLAAIIHAKQSQVQKMAAQKKQISKSLNNAICVSGKILIAIVNLILNMMVHTHFLHTYRV